MRKVVFGFQVLDTGLSYRQIAHCAMVSPHLVHGKEYRDNWGFAQSVPRVSAQGQPDSIQVHTAYPH